MKWLEWERGRGGGYLWWMGSRADGVGDGWSRARMENGCVWIGSRVKEWEDGGIFFGNAGSGWTEYGGVEEVVYYGECVGI